MTMQVKHPRCIYGDECTEKLNDVVHSLKLYGWSSSLTDTLLRESDNGILIIVLVKTSLLTLMICQANHDNNNAKPDLERTKRKRKSSKAIQGQQQWANLTTLLGQQHASM